MIKIGACPSCEVEDDIYLFGEVKLQLTHIESESDDPVCSITTKYNKPRARFEIEDVYVTPVRLRKSNEKYGKFKCENCQHVFDEPKWV